MMLKKLLTIFGFFAALSLIAYAVLPNATVSLLLKMFAFSAGVTIIVGVLYYPLRGAKKGDKVVVVSHGVVPSFLGKDGTLMEDGKVGDKVKVILGTGREVFGVIEEYEDLFSPHRVRLIYEERKI